MRTSQLRRVKEVFLRAQYHPAADRESAARAECGDDPDVLDDVLRLVRVQRQVESMPDRQRATGLPPQDEDPSRPSARPEVAAPLDSGAPRCGDVVLGRYEIRDAIGAGAFGTVHRAYDRIGREFVAVKAVRLTSPRSVEWHVREVASLRRARVPGSVEMLATGHERDWALVVMALVEGDPFPGAGIDVGDAAAILPRAMSLLEAVGHLHASGVYHRDLKPSNVLVSAEGNVTLVDFGIAQDETDASRWLPEGSIAGTLSYLAPERLRGERAAARSELYAIGVMLIEALTGEAPTSGRAPRTGPAAVRERRALTVALEGVVSEPLARLILSFIEHDARDRPQDTWAALDVMRNALGPQQGFDLPRLGGDAAVRAVVESAKGGRALDVVGPPGSGRTRTLEDAERQLRDAGLLVNWVRPKPPNESSVQPRALGSSAQDASTEDLDRELCASLRRRIVDGLVLLVDDFDALDAPTRGLVESVRGLGAVIRVVREPAGPCVRLTGLNAADLDPLIRGPERLFHVRSEIGALLWKRTRGRPRDVAREVRSWCATGLAKWNGALEIGPKQLDRLRASVTPLGVVAASGLLPRSALELWSALTLVGEPISVAALADVVGLPERVVASELHGLVDRGFVGADAVAGRIDLLRGSAHLADVPLDMRRVWSERAAAHLSPRSEVRFHHLVAAGLHEAACRAALDIAVGLVEAGNVPGAIAVLDPALAMARRHVPQAVGLYADLLAAMSEAALGRGTKAAVDLALYHAGLAPQRDGRATAWTAVMEAAAAVLDSDAPRAIRLLDAAGDLPTEAHRRATHVIGCHAGRMTRSVEVQRRRVSALAAWVRRGGGERDARALLAHSTGWLRYEEGRFEEAYRLHARAARLTRRSRARTTSLCDAAMAALEAGDLGPAGALAEEALRAARRVGDIVNEARSELLVRQCAYRLRRAQDVDVELVEAASAFDRDGTRGMIRLTEAAVAWRARRMSHAGELAGRAAEDLRTSGFRSAAVLAAALAGACGSPADLELLGLLTSEAQEMQPVGIAAQAAALAAGTPGVATMPEALVSRARTWALGARLPDMPREVLSPRETESRLRAVQNDAR